ncbi:hypothetical protein [Marinilabilia salmonicolor]|uniref:hypothetical protein n=1 Tax=Marinilabilia salmonicolor TaxID=989 RepID=UPI00029A9DDA|nr:hypothetical protein [Marinilabilia salmonicolor]
MIFLGFFPTSCSDDENGEELEEAVLLFDTETMPEILDATGGTVTIGIEWAHYCKFSSCLHHFFGAE